MSADGPTAAELTAAAAAEALALAGEATGVARKRLQVLAYTLALATRDLEGAPAASGEDAALAGGLRAGARDNDLGAVARELEAPVRERLAAVNPGYAGT
jgi:hypothetical protein